MAGDKSEKMLTTEERELLEIKKKGTFKARKLNKDLFKTVIGLPKVEKMPSTTEFQEFKLQVNERKSITSTTAVLSSEDLAL
jgi:hypothetical protein